ncbi:lysosomal alpha-mannosidase-like [Anticarsia gemmatalis]|uniref:lysosomal alpha-mannosidase-like n=1 Tax=Anticarsia gemmatalis TaxID=129554 RepID=UPI003F759271
MSDESTTSYHAIIDHFTYSLRKINATFMECGRPLVTWQADSFGHSKEFASLMAQMGFDGHFINPISYDEELLRMRARNMEFVWRGSDDLGSDSDIFTHKLFDGYWSPPGFCFGIYCTDPLIITSDSQFRNIEERVAEFVKQVQRRQAPYYTSKHVMVIMGTRFGYHDAKHWFANTDKLIYGVNTRQTGAKDKVFLYYSTPACYVKAVQKHQPKLQTKQDDFIPLAFDKDSYMTGMFTSRPTIKYMAREIHLLLQIVKQLQVFARLEENNKKFEEINWIAGVINDHTIIAGNMRKHVTDYYTRKVHIAKAICMQIIRPAFNTLRNAASSTVYYMCPFNASSCEKINHSIIAIPELAKGLPQRSQPDHEPAMDDELVFVAEGIPPMGYRSYYLQLTNVRTRRSIIKKMPNSKTKKFLTRQIPNMKINEQLILNDDYIDYYDASTKNPHTKIEFGNITKNLQSEETLDVDKDYVLTPSYSNMTQRKVDYEFQEPSFPNIATELPPRHILRDYWTTASTTTLALEEYDEQVETSTAAIIEPHIDPDLYYRRMENSGYFSVFSKDAFIKNEAQTLKVLKTEFVQEVHIKYSQFAGIALRLYKSLPYIEVDWITGPIPVQDNFGKDIFIRYSTNLRNDGVFYTDCNGRQTIKRIKDKRATFTPLNTDNITGNMYPVTSKVYIVDKYKNIRFSVFPDRAEGCTSPNQGQLDFMLHRRILTDEGRRMTILNETEFDKGLVVRGKHHLYFSKADFKPNKIFEKKFAKELELQPKIFTSSHPYYANTSYGTWRGQKNEYSALRKKLPVGVHILTVEKWHDHILLRLENYLEKGEAVKNEIKTVFIKDLFKDFKIISVRETMLATNIWRKDYIQMMWDTEKFVKSFNDVYGNYSNLEFAEDQIRRYEEPDWENGIKLIPQQIRTFVCGYVLI